MKDIKIFLNKKKNIMVMHITRISQDMKKINWLSIEKKILEQEKTLYNNYKKAF